MPAACPRHVNPFRACDGCPLCCCKHPDHETTWAPHGCPDCNKRKAV